MISIILTIILITSVGLAMYLLVVNDDEHQYNIRKSWLKDYRIKNSLPLKTRYDEYLLRDLILTTNHGNMVNMIFAYRGVRVIVSILDVAEVHTLINKDSLSELLYYLTKNHRSASNNEYIINVRTSFIVVGKVVYDGDITINMLNDVVYDLLMRYVYGENVTVTNSIRYRRRLTEFSI